MKFYKRMICPMVEPPALQGMNCSLDPLISEDYWVDDEFEEILIKSWEKLIKDPMSKLCINEKYIEVKLPKPEIMDVKPTDTVCLTFDPDSIDVYDAFEYLKAYEKVCPKETTLVLLPNPNSLDVLDKEAAYKFIEVYREKIDEKYKSDSRKINMTNAEKFEQVFGIKPDTETMVIDCPYEETNSWSKCPYYEELDGGCRCDTWWNEKYKED